MTQSPPEPEREGVLLVDKPVGPTSHDIVSRVRRALGTRRVGHTGTLDPFASGLLVILVGSLTRLSPYLTGLDKSYTALVRLGQRSSTDDPEGELSPGGDPAGLRADEVEKALAGLRGPLLQVPPPYSAKKIQGERAHRMARRGESVSLEPVSVTVFELTLLEIDLPHLRLAVHCSSGTYVRALARDLGDALNVGGHLVKLRRTRVGPLRVDRAVEADAVEPGVHRTDAWLTPAEALSHLPSFEVGVSEAARLASGQSIPVAPPVAGEKETVAVFRGHVLVAMATYESGRLHPRKVFPGAVP